jgi:hypothetical protein
MLSYRTNTGKLEEDRPPTHPNGLSKHKQTGHGTTKQPKNAIYCASSARIGTMPETRNTYFFIGPDVHMITVQRTTKPNKKVVGTRLASLDTPTANGFGRNART